MAELSIELAEKVVEHNLDHDTQIAARSRATSTRSGATVAMAEGSRIEAYARAMLEVARAEGHLAEVEDELFRFARTFDGSDELRMALTDPALPGRAARRGGRGPARGQGTRRPARRWRRSSSAPGGPATSRRSSTGSSSSPRPSASTRSPRCAARSPLDDDQIERLRDALANATSKDVEVKVVVDPSVLGGVVATVGDTVIDGSVRHRLEQLKETDLTDG